MKDFTEEILLLETIGFKRYGTYNIFKYLDYSVYIGLGANIYKDGLLLYSGITIEFIEDFFKQELRKKKISWILKNTEN